VGAAAAWGLHSLARLHEPEGWLAVLSAMSVSALAMLALSAAVLLTPEDRALWRQRLRHKIPAPGAGDPS
jgi:hypothetical protein